MAEHPAVNWRVLGSSPTRGAQGTPAGNSRTSHRRPAASSDAVATVRSEGLTSPERERARARRRAVRRRRRAAALLLLGLLAGVGLSLALTRHDPKATIPASTGGGAKKVVAKPAAVEAGLLPW